MRYRGIERAVRGRDIGLGRGKAIANRACGQKGAEVLMCGDVARTEAGGGSPSILQAWSMALELLLRRRGYGGVAMEAWLWRRGYGGCSNCSQRSRSKLPVAW